MCLWEPLSRQNSANAPARAQKSELRVRTGLMKDHSAEPEAVPLQANQDWGRMQMISKAQAAGQWEGSQRERRPLTLPLQRQTQALEEDGLG